MLITPRPGAHRDNLLKALQQVHREASNLRDAGPSTAYQRLLTYLEWVTDATQLLQDQVSGKDIDRLIQTRRYYALLGACGTLAGSDQQRLVNGLVNQELADREADLGAAATTLSEHMTRWVGPMWLAVADSSFYLNSHRPLADTDLHKVMGLPSDEEILLLFPIAVVDELDRLKETSGAHPRWRAGHTLGRLDEAITSGTSGTLRRRVKASPSADGSPWRSSSTSPATYACPSKMTRSSTAPQRSGSLRPRSASPDLRHRPGHPRPYRRG